MCRIRLAISFFFFFFAVRVNFCRLALAVCVCASVSTFRVCVFVHALFHCFSVSHPAYFHISYCWLYFVSFSIFSTVQKETDKNIEGGFWGEKKKSLLHLDLIKVLCEQNSCKSIDKPTWNVYEIQNSNRPTRRISTRGKKISFVLFIIIIISAHISQIRTTETSLAKRKHVVVVFCFFLFYINSPAFIHSHYTNNHTQCTCSFKTRLKEMSCSFFVKHKPLKCMMKRDMCI